MTTATSTSTRKASHRHAKAVADAAIAKARQLEPTMPEPSQEDIDALTDLCSQIFGDAPSN